MNLVSTSSSFNQLYLKQKAYKTMHNSKMQIKRLHYCMDCFIITITADIRNMSNIKSERKMTLQEQHILY
jgi:hypothetical protein